MHRRNPVNIIKILTILFLNRKLIAASDQFCIFPPEIQGEYKFQNTAINGNRIQYSVINITNDDISPYGLCYSRNGSNFIVVLGNEDDRISCYRCFSLRMVSKNVLLLIHTESDINSKCSSSPETVKCPNEISLSDEKKFTNDFYSIILFRLDSRPHEFCPLTGKIRFDYYPDNTPVCNGYQSSISNCPSSTSLNVNFKNCTKDLQPKKYDCLANWRMQNQNFIAIIESSLDNSTDEKYKCGVYEEDEKKSRVTLKLNNDCNMLTNRNFNQNPQIFKIQTSLDFFDESSLGADYNLSFPKNLEGEWQYMKISRNLLTLKDPSSRKTYYMSLINTLENDRYIVRSRSQCGEETFKCIIISQLHENVVEIQISSKSSKSLPNYDLCNAINFDSREWLTQAKIGASERCPIFGKYFGKLPDAMDLCSIISSDCRHPDIMFYHIGPCDSMHDIYETRVYRCLGHWTDKKSENVYTLTQRVDVVNTYECFVGLMTNGDSIFIREAGEEGNCYKSLDPLSFGMEMNRTEKCPYEEEIIVNPTVDDTSFTKYEVLDENTNYTELTTSTKKSKTSKKQNQESEDINHLYNNIIPSSSSIETSSSTAITTLGFTQLITSLLLSFSYLLLR
ncbi:hypothetical protein PVAND_005539 [Polypedilum vanderplanki]|uniref:Uncharacterized protein n=1 Tax=Polypedilum vanderplanki TaxID=319348 RepID=A0A9J6C0H4_POLVA|nr:hypothetical protein PVAND_005539 [Polypedilum vanderplanki]